MATRGRIGVLRPDGRVESIYNHFDSYPEGLGAALKGFKDQKDIDELIALGNRSVLYSEKHGAPYDWRNKEDLYNEPSRFDDNEDAFYNNDDDWDIEHKYLYKDGNWFISSYGDEPYALTKPSKIYQEKATTAPNLRRRFKNPLDQANAILGGK